jgi:polar amino acid transport system substrate-binding protein
MGFALNKILKIILLILSTVLLLSCGKADKKLPTFTELNDFDQPGVRIAVLQGAVSDFQARDHFKQAEFLSFTSYADALIALRVGKIDAIAFDRGILQYMVRDASDVLIIPDTFDSCDTVAGVSNDGSQFKQQVDQQLQILKDRGVLREMKERWLVEGKIQMPPEVVQEEASLPELKIGTSAMAPPFSFMADNQLTGFDMELGRRLAKALGRKAVFTVMDYDVMPTALQTHKVDLILANLNATKERGETLTFSQSYNVSESTFLVLKKAWRGQGGQTGTAKDNAVSVRKEGFWPELKVSFTRNFLVEDRYKLILTGLETTLLISVWALILGSSLGFGICLLCRSPRKLFRLPAQCFIKLMQGTPMVVFLMIMYYLVFGGWNINPMLVAVLAFGVNMAAYVAEMMRSGIDAVDKGQWEAAYAMGFTKVQTFVKIVAPQALRHILPVYAGEAISLVKMTSVVGYIAIQDLTKMSDIIRSRTYEAFFPLIMTALIYFLLSWILVSGLSFLEYRIDPKKRPRKVPGVVTE